MSWVSENKFLTGFGVVVAAGLGTLGYFTLSAMDKYDAATGKFDAAVNELKRVQGTKPYPSPEHLEEIKAQKAEVAEKLGALQADLKSRVLTVEPLTIQAFQDKLKEAVARVMAKAAAARVTFPDKFYLDFDYQSAPPDAAAAPVLGRQLRAIEQIMDIVTAVGGIDVKKFERTKLPEESGSRKSRGADQGGRRRPGNDSGGGETSGKRLVEKSTVIIKFVSKDLALHQILNALAESKQQFFIVRRVDVQNEHTESPQKTAGSPALNAPAGADAGKPSEPAPGTAPAPAATPPPTSRQGSLVYAFGLEKIEAIIEIEILDFAEPEARQEKGAKGKTK